MGPCNRESGPSLSYSLAVCLRSCRALPLTGPSGLAPTAMRSPPTAARRRRVIMERGHSRPLHVHCARQVHWPDGQEHVRCAASASVAVLREKIRPAALWGGVPLVCFRLRLLMGMARGRPGPLWGCDPSPVGSGAGWGGANHQRAGTSVRPWWPLGRPVRLALTVAANPDGPPCRGAPGLVATDRCPSLGPESRRPSRRGRRRPVPARGRRELCRPGPP